MKNIACGETQSPHIRLAAQQCIAVVRDSYNSKRLEYQLHRNLDPSLSFLDGYVVQSLASGGSTFTPRPSNQSSGPQVIISDYSACLSDGRQGTLRTQPKHKNIWTEEGRQENEGEVLRDESSQSQNVILEEYSVKNVISLEDDWD